MSTEFHQLVDELIDTGRLLYNMGAKPDFRCFRFFVIPDGWVGEFTGNDIATRHVSYETYRAEHA